MAEPPLTESDFEYLDTAQKPEPFVDDFFSEMALSAPDSTTIAMPPEPPLASENPAAEIPRLSTPDAGDESFSAAKTSLASRIKRVLAAWLAKLKPVKSGEEAVMERPLPIEPEAAMARPDEEPLIPFGDAEAENRPAFFKRHAMILMLATGILSSASLAVGVVWLIKHRATPPRPETVAISHPPAPPAALPATAAHAQEAQLAELRAKNARLEQELKQAREKSPPPNAAAAEAPNPDDCVITGKDADYQKTLKDCIKAFNTITGRPPK